MKYQSGDKVLIRKWEDLINDYGLEEGFYVRFEDNYFGEKDKFLCGKIVTLKESKWIDNDVHLVSEDLYENDSFPEWCIEKRIKK